MNKQEQEIVCELRDSLKKHKFEINDLNIERLAYIMYTLLLQDDQISADDCFIPVYKKVKATSLAKKLYPDKVVNDGWISLIERYKLIDE